MPDCRESLNDEYFQMTRETLPDRARRERWVICRDHCFQRILLDNVLGAAWRTRLTAKLPAYRQLSDTQMGQAVSLARRIDAEGDSLLRILNENSLRWRGKVQPSGNETV